MQPVVADSVPEGCLWKIYFLISEIFSVADSADSAVSVVEAAVVHGVTLTGDRIFG